MTKSSALADAFEVEALSVADHVRRCSAVADRYRIPLRAVHEAITLTADELMARYREAEAAIPNVTDAPTRLPEHPIGSARLTPFGGELNERYVDVLTVFPAADIVTVEAEENIRKHPSFAVYREWARNGSPAPYINVFETDSGRLQSTNRRRLLVAQELGISITGWFGRMNTETRLPIKLGDIQQAYAELAADYMPEQIVRTPQPS